MLSGPDWPVGYRETSRCIGSIRTVTAVAVVVVTFNFTINCRTLIKYFGEKHKHFNESTPELRDLVPLIPHIYDHNSSLINLLFLTLFLLLDLYKRKKLRRKGQTTYCPRKPPVIYAYKYIIYYVQWLSIIGFIDFPDRKPMPIRL